MMNGDENDNNSVSDGDLWAAVTKGIKRLHRDHVQKSDADSVKAPVRKPIVENKPASANAQKIILPEHRSRDIDKNTLDRLHKGKIPIEGRIDLHGMTQLQAQDALQDYLKNAYRNNMRCVLVITGKGTPKNSDEALGFWSKQTSGVLKQRLPDWLYDAALSDIVLKHMPAQPKHGGGGAFYVYLRRRRD